ncbi:PQQ-binding-like beta-propeller repeat protein [Actinoplanes sp. NPDC023714]|uniref:outer membrane protein assembly factor BamB family protein n=1 Tax=Actinoplanes sp. NPDC023714 TaxID=3154322 RepID=UPI0033C5E9FD
MTIIELGEFNVPTEPEGSPGEFHPRSVRRALLGAVVLASLLLLGGAAPPATPLVHDVWSAPMGDQDSMAIRKDGIFVFRSTGPATVELTSYDPATGAVRWTRESDGNVSWMYQGPEAGLLLIPGDEKYANLEFDDGSQGQIAYGGSTTAVEASTGRRLWKVTGEVQAVASASVLLADRDSTGDYVTVRLVDARTGAEIWRHAAGGALHLNVQNEGPSPILVILANRAGRTTVLRYADGSVINEKNLPWTPTDTVAGTDTYLSIADDLVLVSRNSPSRARVTAYRAGSLERLWETEMSSYSYISECGPVLCHADAGALYGLEPRTGRRLWELPGFGAAVMVGDRLIAEEVADPPRQVVVDPATGGRVGPGGVGYPMRAEEYNGSLLLLHRVYRDPMRDAVDYLDLTTGEVTRVGLLETFADVEQRWRCGSIDRYLACQREDRLVVTAVG